MDAVPGAGGCEVLAGRYEVGVLVGLGGTARVYRARDQVGDATVAVKIFPAGSAAGLGPQDGRHDDVHRDGSRELAALDGMRHPGLVGVRDSGVDADGRPFVVMDFVEGQSLAARLRHGALPAAAVTAMGTTLADALAYVHANGVVHRDVKPGNVLLDGDGHARLTDFGIARLIDATRVTATGLVVGTAAYMAPEQVRGEVVGPPADMYALGLVLLEAVTGRREFEGGALEAAIARLHRSPVVPPGVPEPLASQIARMTAPDPADRPAAPDVAAALARRTVPRRPLDGLLARRLVSVGAVASLAASVVAATVLLTSADTPAGAPAEPALAIAAPDPVTEPKPVAAPPVTTTTPEVADEPPAAVPTTQRRASVPVALAGRTTGTRTVTRPAPATEQAGNRPTSGRANRGGSNDDKKDDAKGGRPGDARDDDNGTSTGTPNDDPAPGDDDGDSSGPGSGGGNNGGNGGGGNNGGNGGGNDDGDDSGSGNSGGGDGGDDSSGSDDDDNSGTDGDDDSSGSGNSGRGSDNSGRGSDNSGRGNSNDD